MLYHDTNAELAADLRLRRERLAELMREQGADALIATTNVDLFYLTGRIPDGYFYMTAGGESYLFVRRPQTWPGERIEPIKHPAEIPGLLTKLGIAMPRALMLEEELPHSEYQRIADIFTGAVILPSALRRARMIKTPYEQDVLRETGLWHVAAQECVPDVYRPGMTDLEFEIAICTRFRLLGHPGLFRIAGHRMEAAMGTILAGDNAKEPSPFDFALGGTGFDYLPFAANGTELAEGTTVLVDVSGCIKGYLTDMSRTYSIGELPHAAYDMHEAALEIQAAFVAAAQVGARCCDLYNQALDIARRRGFEECFMGLSQRAKFVGHSLGLEINEPPVIAPRDVTSLEAGMLIALEPKFIIPGVGAVGIENTFLITQDGPERLTPGDDAIVSLE